MPVTTIHAAPTALGDGSGSSAANAIELFPGGNLNSVVAGHDYAASTLQVLCQNTGTYTLSQSLTTGVFTVTAPIATTNQLFLIGCDSNGTPIVPDYGWRCEESDLVTTGFAAINFTLTTSSMINGVAIRMMFFTVAATTDTVVLSTPLSKMSWCSFTFTSTASTGVGYSATTTTQGIANCQLRMIGSSYARIYTGSSSGNQFDNVRIKGDATATTGTRYGVAMSLASAYPIVTGRVFVVDVTGVGIINYNVNASAGLILSNATVVNCGVGVSVAGTTSARLILSNCVITGCTTGVDQTSGLYVFDNVLLRNTTNYGTTAELPVTEPYAFITTETDSQLYANHSAGDYRIKSTSAHWAKNRGAGDEAASVANTKTFMEHGAYMGSRGIA